MDLLKLSAYILLDDYPIHRLFILLGSGGNGKGEFMRFLTRLVGRNNITTTALDTISRSRFEISRLYKKKLALIGELNYNKIGNTDRLKKITGQDPLQGEYKFKDPFEFYNTAKVVIATNDLPETTDKTDGFYRRTIIIEFPNHFDNMGISVVDTIPEWEIENFIKHRFS